MIESQQPWTAPTSQTGTDRPGARRKQGPTSAGISRTPTETVGRNGHVPAGSALPRGVTLPPEQIEDNQYSPVGETEAVGRLARAVKRRLSRRQGE